MATKMMRKQEKKFGVEHEEQCKQSNFGKKQEERDVWKVNLQKNSIRKEIRVKGRAKDNDYVKEHKMKKEKILGTNMKHT